MKSAPARPLGLEVAALEIRRGEDIATAFEAGTSITDAYRQAGVPPCDGQ
jgi:hypothetical protein